MTVTTTTTTTSTAIYVYVYVSIYAVFWFLFWDSLTCGAIYEEHPYAKAGRDGGCRGCWLLQLWLWRRKGRLLWRLGLPLGALVLFCAAKYATAAGFVHGNKQMN